DGGAGDDSIAGGDGNDLLAGGADDDTTGFLGNELNLAYYFPNLSTLFDPGNFAPRTFTVATGVEVSDFGIRGSGEFTVDVGQTSIAVSFLDSGSFQTASFNGLVFHDQNGTLPDIVGVSLESASGLIPSLSLSFDSDDVFVSWVGPYNSGSTFTLSV